jgi:hypothetical protein
MEKSEVTSKVQVIIKGKGKNVKISLLQAVETRRVARG